MRLLMFIAGFLLVSFSQGQTPPPDFYANFYKTSFTHIYDSMETFAQNKWDKKKDIKKEINAQATAYTELGLILADEAEIKLPVFQEVILRNSKGNLENVYAFKDNTVDWVQVILELKNELNIEDSSINQSVGALNERSTPNTSTSSGDGLNTHGKTIRSATPELYNAIKTFAINKWNTDHQMILHEINSQSDAYFKFSKIMKSKQHLLIIMDAVKKWSDGSDMGKYKTNSTIDWVMVVHEIETQVKAKNSY